MKLTFIVFVINSFMLLISTVVAAVDENTINSNAEKLVLSSSVQYFDNYHPRLSDGISATALSAGINGKLLSKHQSVWLQATYSGAYTQFKIDENELVLEDQFSQYNIELLSRLFMGNKWYVDLQGTHRNVDYLLGTGIAKFRPATISGDSVSSNEISASVVYGGDINDSDGRASRRFVKFALSHLDQDYADKNTYSNLFDLKRDIAEIGVNYKLSEVTQFETNFQFEKIDFVDDSQLDNDIYRLLLGFQWQGTGQTHLKLLVGGYKRVYQFTPDNQGFLAELEAEYTPRNNLTIALKGSQTTSTGVIENALDTVTKSASIAINYDYKEHIKFMLKAYTNNTQFEQTGEDQTSVDSAVGVGSDVTVYDYLTVGLALQRESLKYDLLALDYIQNKAELTCRYAF